MGPVLQGRSQPDRGQGAPGRRDRYLAREGPGLSPQQKKEGGREEQIKEESGEGRAKQVT